MTTALAASAEYCSHAIASSCSDRNRLTVPGLSKLKTSVSVKAGLKVEANPSASLSVLKNSLAIFFSRGLQPPRLGLSISRRYKPVPRDRLQKREYRNMLPADNQYTVRVLLWFPASASFLHLCIPKGI